MRSISRYCCVAAVLGVLLGLDLELRGHAAGVRTQGIVCGAAQWPLVAVAVLVAVIILTLLRFVERHWLELEISR